VTCLLDRFVCCGRAKLVLTDENTGSILFIAGLGMEHLAVRPRADPDLLSHPFRKIYKEF
jgi:hypothetical protein